MGANSGRRLKARFSAIRFIANRITLDERVWLLRSGAFAPLAAVAVLVAMAGPECLKKRVTSS
ncbi:MAG: hypothetical protein WB869_17525, partial [Candidatus Acidiferrales bacterium]